MLWSPPLYRGPCCTGCSVWRTYRLCLSRNKGPSSRKEAPISEFEVTTDDENPGEQARGTPLGNSVKQLRKRSYQMRYEDNSGERSGGDNCTDGSEDEPVSYWKQSGGNLSGNLRLSRAGKQITNKQTVLKKLKKVSVNAEII